MGFINTFSLFLLHSKSDFMIGKAFSKQKLILFSVLLSIHFLYYISSRYLNTSNDGSHFALVSAMISDHTVEIKNYLKYTGDVDFCVKNGVYYSDRLPGNAFLMAPFFVFGKICEKLHLNKLTHHENLEEVTVILECSLCGVMGVYFLFLMFRHIKFSFNLSLFASVIYAICTLNWQESTHVFSHAASMCFVIMAFYFLLKMNSIYENGFFAFVFLLSYASMVELQNILLFIPAILYVVLKKKIDLKERSQNLKYIGLGFMIFASVISVLLIYNFITFNELTLKSNKYNPNYPEEGSFFTSLSGDVVSGLDRLFTNFLNPEVYAWKVGVQNDIPGLLTVSPVLIFSLIGMRLFFKKHFHEALLFTMIIILIVAIGAFHKIVFTRYIFTMTPFLFFPLIFVLDYVIETKNNLLKIIFWPAFTALAVYSCLRVCYVTHTYWGREITDLFPFVKELKVYFLFLLLVFIALVLIQVYNRRFNPVKAK